jgi:protein-S-isoprenylcysteine O-methyltransferase Ste14
MPNWRMQGQYRVLHKEWSVPTSLPTRRFSILALDLFERGMLVILYGIFAIDLLNGFHETGSVLNLILLASEGSVILFVLVRRFTANVSLRPIDWLTATLGTTLPLLVKVDGLPVATPAIAILCMILMLTGVALQLAAKLVLRRSFGIVAANRGVKVGGPYKILRHPMYAGYALTHIGFLLCYPSLWNLGVYATVVGLQIARILAEEQILSQDAAYRGFAARTPYRLLPGVF